METFIRKTIFIVDFMNSLYCVMNVIKNHNKYITKFEIKVNY